MSLATLAINDGQSTPVSHNFVEVQEFPTAMWSERLGIAIGEPSITIASSRPDAKRRTHRVSVSVAVPVLETISGDAGGYAPAPRVAFTLRGMVEFVCPDRCTTAQRADLYAFVSNTLAKAMVKAMVVDQLPAA